jgi:hypothetical protein
MIKRGDTVRMKSEWADPGDELITFVATDDESKGRVSIMAVLGLPYNPIQVVNVEMVEPAPAAPPDTQNGSEDLR